MARLEVPLLPRPSRGVADPGLVKQRLMELYFAEGADLRRILQANSPPALAVGVRSICTASTACSTATARGTRAFDCGAGPICRDRSLALKRLRQLRSGAGAQAAPQDQYKLRFDDLKPKGHCNRPMYYLPKPKGNRGPQRRVLKPLTRSYGRFPRRQPVSMGGDMRGCPPSIVRRSNLAG
jgi:hypothetical protein